jgi:hypothetical protein
MSPEALRSMLNSLSEDERIELLNSLSDEELNKYADLLSQKPSTMDKAKELGMDALSAVGKALDYAGGVARTAGAAALMDSVDAGDVLNALMAKPLAGDEILKRAGMPEGGKLSDLLPSLYNETGEGWRLQRGGWADASGRGAAGLALEMATDPLNYVSGGLAGLAKSGGKKLYKRAFVGADEVAEKFGKKLPSELMLKEGAVGTAKGLAKKAEKKAAELLSEKDRILKEMLDAGVTINPEDAWKYLESEAIQAALLKNKIKQEMIEDIASKYKDLLDTGPLNPFQADSNKMSLYDKIKAAGYDQSRPSDAYIDLLKTIPRGYREALEKGASSINRDLKKLNEELGTFLTAQNALTKAGAQEAKKSPFTSFDGILFGLAEPAAFAAKKGVDVSKTALFNTAGGVGLSKLGELGSKVTIDENLYRALLKAMAVNAERKAREELQGDAQ